MLCEIIRNCKLCGAPLTDDNKMINRRKCRDCHRECCAENNRRNRVKINNRMKELYHQKKNPNQNQNKNKKNENDDKFK